MRCVLIVIAVALAFGSGMQVAMLWSSNTGLLSASSPPIRTTQRNIELDGDAAEDLPEGGDPIGDAVRGALAIAKATVDPLVKRARSAVPLPVHRPLTNRSVSTPSECAQRAADYNFVGFHAKDVAAIVKILNVSEQCGPTFWVYEVGALSGDKDGSISHFFDRALGWSTLLQEANPVNFKGLQGNRPEAVLVEGAICSADNEAGTLEFLGDYGGSVGAVKTMDPVHRKTFHGTREDTYVVRCEPLAQTLARVGIPHIDIWSLDIEGAELVALDSMDWNIPVRALVIEISKLDLVRDRVIEAKIAAVGFRFHSWISSLNQLWVNPGFEELKAARAALVSRTGRT